MTDFSGCAAFGQEIPAAHLGPLRESQDLLASSRALQRRINHDGYLFLRGALVQGEVLAARRAVFSRLAEVDEVASPGEAGIATGRSERLARVGDLGAFWKAVVDMAPLRQVTNGSRLGEIASRLLGEPSRGMDYIFLRAGAVGRATGLHYDFPFFTRHTRRVYTVWVPLGPVPVTDGPIAVVEGSQHFSDILDGLDGLDVARDRDCRAEISHDPAGFAARRGCRLLTADFAPGDVLIFSPYLLHGALDNQNAEGRVRLSCDVRYQPAGDPLDPRYFGDDPRGTFGGGYGELNGAKPLTEEWHRR